MRSNLRQKTGIVGKYARYADVFFSFTLKMVIFIIYKQILST
jgi:hypothetical protein